jgi:hypothetical protein
MYMHKTDKRFSPNIIMSASAYYHFDETGYAIAELTEKALPILREMLSFDEEVQIRVTALKSKNLNGRFFNKTKMVEIDCRLGLSHALQILAHELVHAEQYHTGKLQDMGNKTKVWNNETIAAKPASYKKYRDLPWEAEAWARQEELANAVMAKLGLTA